MVDKNFAEFDRNGDGSLQIEEFVDMINSTFGKMGQTNKVSRREAEHMMGRFDFDKNNSISKAELYKAYKNFFGLA